MEPIIWVALFSLLFGGYHLSSDNETNVVAEERVEVEKNQFLSETPIFERGKYYQTGQGYYISNLSQDKQKIEGCDSPILTTDLSVARDHGEIMAIDTMQMQCEE